MTARHWLMLAGGGIAAWLAFFGDNSPEAQEAELAKPVARSAAQAANEGPPFAVARRSTAEAKKQGEVQVLALLPRARLIAADGAGGVERGLFAAKSFVMVPPLKPAKEEPPPKPMAPPLPFTYLGKRSAGGLVEVYLAHGDAVIVAHDQSVIEGAYRVDAIQPPTLTLTYLPLNQVQQLSIGAID